MAVRRGRKWWLVLPVVALAFWAWTRGGDGPEARNAAGPEKHPSASAASPSRPTAKPGRGGAYDPADYAAPVRTYAKKAGVGAQLLMAILYNEAYKPHDPALERSWQRYKPDAAFGIANMHRAAFDDTKKGRDFADRRWDELPDDRNLAIEAAAWHLHDLAAQLPSRKSAAYTKDELLALGYNTGGGNMLAFARGVRPGPQAQSYLEKLRDNWDKAGAAVRG
ncbi:lytic transglycosylase domain-containing protein [Streptomyces sp. NPDC059070]|uniref:lytic transglycosylase domain-containing protein n=1 Tax=unclassified Streptomyces TaxID=2593676 RepID=UPI0034E29C3B